MKPKHPTRAVGILSALAVALAACGSETSQADLCERVAHELYGGPGTLSLVKTETRPGARPSVAVLFRPANAKASAPLKITCTFAGKDGDSRLDLVGVRRPNNRPLHLVSVIYLKHQLMPSAAR